MLKERLKYFSLVLGEGSIYSFCFALLLPSTLLWFCCSQHKEEFIPNGIMFRGPSPMFSQLRDQQLVDIFNYSFLNSLPTFQPSIEAIYWNI